MTASNCSCDISAAGTLGSATRVCQLYIIWKKVSQNNYIWLYGLQCHFF